MPPLATDCDRHLTHIGDLLVLGRPANDELCRVPIPHRHPDISLQAVSWGLRGYQTDGAGLFPLADVSESGRRGPAPPSPGLSSGQ